LAFAEDCDDGDDCTATAIGFAEANDNSSASAFNLAVADGWNQGPATASAVGGASASDGSEAESVTIAIADGPNTTAAAGAFCVTLLGDVVPTCVGGGGASASDGGTASAENIAVADGPNSAALRSW
jgi:hypothetical protein